MNNDPSNHSNPMDGSNNQLIRNAERLMVALAAQFREAGESLSQLFSLSSGVSLLISKTQDSLAELKKVDALLTRIDRLDGKLSQADLEKLGNDAFEAAGKYGKKTSDYLAAIQNASRAGYHDAAGIAELSLALQSAGNMTAELADQYIMAADKAYGLGGSVEKLTEILDGSTHIASRNAVPLEELATGMATAASDAAALGADAKEAAAALGTIITVTQLGGAEAARALHAILLNLRQVADEEAGVSPHGLAAYEAACRSLNVSLRETKNGTLSLREPMETIHELAAAYSELPSGDTRKSALLDSVGGGLNAQALDALLSHYSLYEKMFEEYATGTGSLAVAVEQTSHSLENSLNRLSNTWTDTVGNIADSGSITAIINALNSLLTVLNHVTEAFGPLATIGVGAGITAFVKNFA